MYTSVSGMNKEVPQEVVQDCTLGPHVTADGQRFPTKSFFVPKIMITNVRSLTPKIEEVQEFVNRNDITMAFITEPWLKPTIMDSVINIPGYTVLRKDRASDNHGVVCLYIRNDYLMYTELRDLACCSDHEILWVQLLPKRLPRGFSSLIVAVVYHPHWSGTENDPMRDHLFQSLAIAESKYPNCAFIVAGDFNPLDVTSIKRHFNMQQIVKKTTRKYAILDFVLTNMKKYYKEPRIFPPFDRSDHNTIIAEGQTMNRGCSTKVLFKRDKRTSRKAELGRYLAVLEWDTLFSSIETFEELVDVFNNVVSPGLYIDAYKKDSYKSSRRSMDDSTPEIINLKTTKGIS